MFDIGFLELLVIAILGLLVLGPERLPKAARTIGLLLGRVRRTMTNFQDDLERQLRTEELREKLKDPYATFLDDDDRKSADTSADSKSDSKADSSVPKSSTAVSDSSASDPATPSSTEPSDSATKP